ncbi:arrestin domain-containing protein 3 [Elysia marginata]|uniref:Arrestin domain-containing protein 3 n=1 Tax=Elysia marginata TaxID=1093978 RepID=A0AAV4JJQ7_9GAST|nr:arrestin domain-containing protein 3 [Elysia marginata]
MVLKASQVQEYEERQQFVQQCSLFRGWNAKFRSLLEMSLRKEIHPFGSVIVQQGAPVTGLVFILRGQAKITMDPSRHLQQYRQLMTKSRSLVPTSPRKTGTEEKENGKVHHVRSKTPVTSAQIGVRRKLGYAAAERRLMTKTVDICCIEKDEIIGDVEMVLDLETNTETVISTATTTVLVLNTKNYERLVTKKHPYTVTRLTQWAYNKVSTRSCSSKGMFIQLFRDLEEELRERLPRPAPPAKRVEILKEQEVVMNQLVDLFVQGKAPLIQPCVPNSLFYRQRSAKRNKILMENPYAQLRTLKHIDTFGRIRRKVPRSIQQLKNNIEAERELLKDNRREYVENPEGKAVNSGLHNLRSRPTITGSMLRITECGPEEDRFGVTSAQLDSADRLDRKAVVEIYQELEQVNRETQEMRMRLICSASAKQERRQARASARREGAKSAAATLMEQQVLNVESANRQGYSDDEADQAGSDNDCFDWETSETNLRDLESRVASFCRSVTPARALVNSRPASAVAAPVSATSTRPGTAQVSDGLAIKEMRRFEIEDPACVPLPGGVVYVHKKPCKFPGVVCNNTAVHKHVRRFILSKEPRAAWVRTTPAATSIDPSFYN